MVLGSASRYANQNRLNYKLIKGIRPAKQLAVEGGKWRVTAFRTGLLLCVVRNIYNKMFHKIQLYITLLVKLLRPHLPAQLLGMTGGRCTLCA